MAQSHIDTSISERFCSTDSDITFQSCDGCLFKIHSRNLEANSNGFASPPGTSASTAEEIVSLSETSEILDLLFQYMYPQRHPELKAIDFDVLSALAEAAEKYQVFGAMIICSMRMEESHGDHPLEVIAYAAKHGYYDLLDIVAPASIHLSPSEALEVFPLVVYHAWLDYYEQWLGIIRFSFQKYSDSELELATEYCGLRRNVFAFLQRLGVGGPASLRDLDALFQSFDEKHQRSCSECRTLYRNWRGAIEDKLSKVRKLSTFL